MNTQEFLSSIDFGGNFDDFLDKNNIHELFTYGEIKNEEIGYNSKEKQIKGYFSDEVYQVNKNLSSFKYNDNTYYTVFVYNDDISTEYYIFNDKEKAENEYNSISKDDYYKPLDEEIEEFKNRLKFDNDDIDIIVEDHHQNTTYIVKYKGDFLESGYRLDQSLADEINAYYTLKLIVEAKYCLEITNFDYSDNTLTLKNGLGNDITVDFFYQEKKGVSDTSLIDLFNDTIDINEVFRGLQDDE